MRWPASRLIASACCRCPFATRCRPISCSVSERLIPRSGVDLHWRRQRRCGLICLCLVDSPARASCVWRASMSLYASWHKISSAAPHGRPTERNCTMQVSDTAETVIQPPTGWQLINFAELWQYRDLLYFLAWRDVKVRYKQAALGVAWAILQPAMMMLIFFIVFSVVSNAYQGDKPYLLFVFTALLPWSFFATSIANAGNSVIGSERLITKIYFQIGRASCRE